MNGVSIMLEDHIYLTTDQDDLDKHYTLMDQFDRLSVEFRHARMLWCIKGSRVDAFKGLAGWSVNTWVCKKDSCEACRFANEKVITEAE